MSNTDWTVPELTDEEIKVIIRNSDYDLLLMPIKKENRRYLKYRRVLGTLTKRSALVQKYLPDCVLKLYKSRDPAYVNIIEDSIRHLQECLIPFIEINAGRKMTLQEVQALSADELAEILKKHAESDGGNIIDSGLLQVQFKMNGLTLSDEDRSAIDRILTEDLETDYQNDNEDGTVEDQNNDEESVAAEESIANEDESAPVMEKPKKKRAKKLSAEEKAEKNRLALEKKQAILAETEKNNESEDADSEEDFDHDTAEPEISYEEDDTQVTDTEKKDDSMTPRSEDIGNNDNLNDDGTHIFVGYIDIRSMTFYNFQPIGLLENGKFVFKKRSELDEMLPESVYGNINIRYDFNTDAEYIEDLLHQGQLMILQVSLDDLQDNITPSGERNKTGYYVMCRQAMARHQLRYLYEDGLYRCITPSLTLEELATKKTAFIPGDTIDYELDDGEKILLRIDGTVFGPFKVKVSEQMDKYIINPMISEHQYIATGYKNDDIIKEIIEEDPERDYGDPVYEAYYRIRNGAVSETIDVIPDAVLMNSLKDYIHEHSLTNAPDAGVLADADMKVLKGKYVTDEVMHGRVSRIIQLLNDQERIKEYSSQIADALYDMVSTDQESDQANGIIDMLLESHPELTDQIQSSRLVAEHINTQKRELENLKAQKESMLQMTEEQRKAEQNRDIDKEIEAKQQQLAELDDKLALGGDYDKLQQKIDRLKEEAEYQENHKSHLQEDTKDLESAFLSVINNYSGRIADITLDGYISNKMLEAAVKWESDKAQDKYHEILESEKDAPKVSMTPDELTDYVVRVIQKVRPNYDRNTIINLMVCTTQGFLTILSGEPGNGKTSLCNILGKTLGLMNDDPARYVQVSVERGWTSKRDFVGYYNPLTKSFEENNHAVYDGLELLDMESRNNLNRYPFLILLDEANLSPMEYYWADFMNVSDDRTDNHTVNLGSDNILEIPETLHFIATINNDHTTEALSPRLIDRAFVITLPKHRTISYNNNDISDDIEPVEWEDLKRAFSTSDDIHSFNGEIQRVYDEVSNYMRKQNFQISARTDIAIHKYWRAASDRMVSDKNNNDPGIIALDYAVAQKLLPKIQGAGEEFGIWLDGLENICQKDNLLISMQIVEDIQNRGKRNMNYFQFFD